MVIELTRRGSDDVLAVACGACGMVFALVNRDIAEACCVCSYCNLPMTGGRVGSEHASCASERWAEQARERGDRHADVALIHPEVTTLPDADYSGPVYWNDHGPGEGYFADTAALREWCAGSDTKVPAWVWACDIDSFGIDAQYVVELSLEECHEDARSSVTQSDIEELQTLIDGWIKGVSVPPTWNVDHTRAVVLA